MQVEHIHVQKMHLLSVLWHLWHLQTYHLTRAHFYSDFDGCKVRIINGGFFFITQLLLPVNVRGQMS